MHLIRSLLVVVAVAGTVVAQPPRGEPGGPPQGSPNAHETDPAAMKARLERWLEETKHREEVITAALKKLADGASPDDVRKGMEPGARAPRGGTPQQHENNPAGGQPGGRPRREQGPSRAGAEGRNEPFDREQVLDFIGKQNPEMAARMRAMVKESPEGADRFLSRLAPQIREVMAERDEQTRDIRTAQLNNGWMVMGAIREVRETAKSGDTAARARGIERMKALLGQGFDLRVQLHEREVAVLEERLGKLKQELLSERGGRESFIAERLKMATEPRERREPKTEGQAEGKQGPQADPKP